MGTDKRKEALQSRLADMEKRLSAVTRDITKTLPSDFAEQATERENDDVLEEIAKETKLSIANLKAALQRIDDDNYGLCGKCGDEIAPARLDALPESTLCVHCAT